MTGVGGTDRSHKPQGTTDAGITPIHEARLTNMAVRRGWLGNRWPTRETVAEFQARVAAKGATLIDRAVLTTNKLMMSDDPRAMGIAVRCALTMESQNQADDHRDQMSGEDKGMLDGRPVGTVLTPDMVATAMDATIPSAPEEVPADDQSPVTDAGVDAAEVQPAPESLLPIVSPVPSGGCGPEIW